MLSSQLLDLQHYEQQLYGMSNGILYGRCWRLCTMRCSMRNLQKCNQLHCLLRRLHSSVRWYLHQQYECGHYLRYCKLYDLRYSNRLCDLQSRIHCRPCRFMYPIAHYRPLYHYWMQILLNSHNSNRLHIVRSKLGSQSWWQAMSRSNGTPSSPDMSCCQLF